MKPLHVPHMASSSSESNSFPIVKQASREIKMLTQGLSFFKSSVFYKIIHSLPNCSPVWFCLSQMAVEMSTLRNKRIELLKGMQGNGTCLCKKKYIWLFLITALSSVTAHYYTCNSTGNI